MIEIKDLEHAFGNKMLFRQEGDFSIYPGVNYLIGLNGTGKTTLFKLLLGFLKPISGTILYDNHKIGDSLDRIGVVFDTPCFYPYLSGVENLSYFSKIQSGEITMDRIRTAMENWELEPDQALYKTYSLGMKKKLSIILALLRNPDYWFMDEPFNGLDTDAKRKLVEHIQIYQKKQKTIILAAYEISFNLMLADHILLIHNKKLMYFPNIRNIVPALIETSILLPKETHLEESMQPFIRSQSDLERGLEVRTTQRDKQNVIDLLRKQKINILEEYEGDNSIKDIVQRLEELSC